MRGFSLFMFAAGTGLLALGSGCATPGNADPVVQTQPDDRLVDSLNRCRADVDRLLLEKRAADDRAMAAQRDAEALRAQLASAQQTPPPAPTPSQAAPGWTPIPGGAMTTLSEDLLFAPGKVTLRPEARKTLDQIVRTIESQYSDKDILVFGHTDDQPIKKSGWEDNWELSAERSLAVVRYLGEHGIGHNRLVAAGAGEHWPRVDNKSDANKAKNRRVEIFAIDHAQLHPRNRG